LVPTHILIVDDDESIRTVLADLFRGEGYVVHIACGGRQALVALATDPVDVLLTDIAMPGMDGRELARILHERGSQVPLVVMTAARGLVAAPPDMNAVAFVQKPFDVDFLLETIDRVTRHPN
jgi:DNA-binding NtrC family response regulator